MPRLNDFNQPLGEPVEAWQPRPQPEGVTLTGCHCRLEPLDAARHADALYTAYSQAADGRDWTYLFVGPFDSAEQYREYTTAIARSTDPRHYAIIDLNSGEPVGTIALMRIDPAHGVIEVGSVTFSPLLKQSVLSTEAQYLLMRYVFDTLGYRRYEWKCDSLNEPSRRAAQRLGFTFEGIFRQAVIYKGRSRDTAWFSLLAQEWPMVRESVRGLVGSRKLRRARPPAAAPGGVALTAQRIVACQLRGIARQAGLPPGRLRPADHLVGGRLAARQADPPCLRASPPHSTHYPAGAP
ncbi:GNAT family N-acetyltransferase [Pseudomonas sp. KNUC1026]|uniref:GNAT family N-acetyltransferase n=1 Tax=Pseudomonas sp. KNUC1026 TaxID=2893890 RepID=UPI001F3CEE95|nr:GNAT family protein [Pseudomonas sp. KNUC1026]UFH50671.1 GNAT family N-acetyltransferase [Pseudomonas sp. KNUC1026]